MAKLTKEEVVTIHVLRHTGETNQAIAARLGITEGAVRYHLRRQAQAASDGRSKLSLIQQLQLTEVVDHWHAGQLERLPPGRLHGDLPAENDLLHVVIVPASVEPLVFDSALGRLFLFEQA